LLLSPTLLSQTLRTWLRELVATGRYRRRE
jgi:hypothetical protein